MNRLRGAHNEKNLLPIDLPTVEENQKDSKENQENSTIKELGNVALHTKEETNKFFVPASLNRNVAPYEVSDLSRISKLSIVVVPVTIPPDSGK